MIEKMVELKGLYNVQNLLGQHMKSSRIFTEVPMFIEVHLRCFFFHAILKMMNLEIGSLVQI